jgi:hypothetical protein
MPHRRMVRLVSTAMRSVADASRAALRRELEVSIAEARAGHVVDAAMVLAELRAQTGAMRRE